MITISTFFVLKRKPRKLFFLYFISFFLVILVPVLLLSLSSYRLAYTSIVKEIRSADYNTVQQTSSSLHRVMENLVSLSIQLGLDGRIYAASNTEQSSFLLNDVKDRITNLANENEYVQSIQLYFFNSKLILSSDGPNRTLPGQLQDQWIAAMQEAKKSMLWLPTRTYVNHDGNAYDIATVIVALPVAFPEETGYIAVHFYEDKLNQFLRDMDPDRNRMIYLAAADGTIISGYESSLRRDPMTAEQMSSLLAAEDHIYIGKAFGTDALITIGEQLRNDWKIVSITPLDYVEEKMSYVRHMLVWIGLLLILFGTLTSYLLSKSMYNPIKALLDKIKGHHSEFSSAKPEDQPSNGSAFTDAMSIVEEVFLRHKKLESVYRTNYEGMVERFLYRLFYNRDNLTAEEIEQKIIDLNLSISLEHYVVVLVEIDDYSKWKDSYKTSDLNLLRYATKNIAQEIFSSISPSLAVETSDSQMAILIHLAQVNQEEPLSDAAEAIIEAVRHYLPFTITIAFGTTVDHILQAHHSFHKAEEVMRHKLVLSEASVLYPEQIAHRDIFDYFYPAHLEKALINHVRAGNYEDVLQVLRSMQNELMNKPNLSYEHVFRMYNRLIDAAIDMVDDLGLSWPDVYGAGNVYQELTKHDSIESIHAWMSQVLKNVCQAMELLRPPPSKVDTALHYISEHYRQDISVEQIANEVQLNSAYFSRIFKQAVGKTVLEHLTDVRLNESKRLLVESALTVQEIAALVGYNNTTSFIRFFRKHENITPGEYRKIKSYTTGGVSE